MKTPLAVDITRALLELGETTCDLQGTAEEVTRQDWLGQTSVQRSLRSEVDQTVGCSKKKNRCLQTAVSFLPDVLVMC